MAVMAGAVENHMLLPAPWLGEKAKAILISIA
jgi:hypothetical protein